MSKTYIGFVVAVLTVAVGALWYTRTPEAQETNGTNMGTYAYTCDGGVEFYMTPSSDMMSLKIEPVRGMAYPPISALADSPTDSGRRFRSADFELQGRGEGVTLYAVASGTTYNCTPQPNPDKAPFNFGD